MEETSKLLTLMRTTNDLNNSHKGRVGDKQNFPASFCLFSSFSHHNSNINCDCVLGNWTQCRSMEGEDGSTELWCLTQNFDPIFRKTLYHGKDSNLGTCNREVQLLPTIVPTYFRFNILTNTSTRGSVCGAVCRAGASDTGSNPVIGKMYLLYRIVLMMGEYKQKRDR